jgi:hypothetical protein
MALDIADILTEYGTYYRNGGQNTQRLLRRPYISSQTEALFGLLPTDDTPATTIVYRLRDHAGGDARRTIVVLFNGNRQATRLPVPSGRYSVVLAGSQINEQGSRTLETAAETLTVEVGSTRFISHDSVTSLIIRLFQILRGEERGHCTLPVQRKKNSFHGSAEQEGAVGVIWSTKRQRRPFEWPFQAEQKARRDIKRRLREKSGQP